MFKINFKLYKFWWSEFSPSSLQKPSSCRGTHVNVWTIFKRRLLAGWRLHEICRWTVLRHYWLINTRINTHILGKSNRTYCSKSFLATSLFTERKISCKERERSQNRLICRLLLVTYGQQSSKPFCFFSSRFYSPIQNRRLFCSPKPPSIALSPRFYSSTWHRPSACVIN